MLSAPSVPSAASSSVAKPGASARGGPLDLLRFLAAFFIVIYHGGTTAPVPLDTVGTLFQRGYLATDYFLMLSGFVLAKAYGPKVLAGQLSVGLFMRRRLMRLWPAHLIVLVAFAILVGFSERAGLHLNRPGWFVFADWPAQALLLHGLGVDIGGGWNLPSWSLSALLACYLVFPVLWSVQSRVPAVIVAGAALMGLALAAEASLRWLHMPLYDLPTYLGVVRAVPLFVLGAAIARLVQAVPVSPRAGRWCLGSGAIALAALQCFGRLDLFSMAAIALAIFGAGALPKGGSRLAAAAGRVSFSLFLTHALSAALWVGALHSLFHRTVGGAQGWLLWGGGMVFALIVAVLFDRYVDQPVQAWLKAPRRASAWRAGAADLSARRPAL